MPFQPFGYEFELFFAREPADVKAAIRARKKGWFNPTDGARGWIVGPFVCLWFSAFDRYGPMVFARISGDRSGTTIRGRAGSDLNGLLLMAVLWPLLAFFLFEIVSTGSAGSSQLLVLGVVVLLAPLTFWWAHKDRRQAEPLVRFLKDCLEPRRKKARRPLRADDRAELGLSVNGETYPGPVTSDAVQDALLGVGAGDFLILKSSPETYIQIASSDGDHFVIEVRKGSANQHFKAVRKEAGTAPVGDPSELFQFDEVLDALLAYRSGSPMPGVVGWERL